MLVHLEQEMLQGEVARCGENGGRQHESSCNWIRINQAKQMMDAASGWVAKHNGTYMWRWPVDGIEWKPILNVSSGASAEAAATNFSPTTLSSRSIGRSA
jgi:hypothetical protein